ncbi:MAG: hypothetical protein HND47_08225 [Chloroflexi bacterium]|nr:hypothetical protein [Chloroflexota bacterium]
MSPADAVGIIPGEAMILLGLAYYTALAAVAIATVTMTRATGEILPRFGDESAPAAPSQEGRHTGLRALLVPRRRRRQLLALIITDKAGPVSKRILTDLKRGVTALQGKGMYTGERAFRPHVRVDHHRSSQPQIRGCREGPKAVVIVSPAQGNSWRRVRAAGGKIDLIGDKKRSTKYP